MIDPSEVAVTLRDFQAIAIQKVEHVLLSPPAPKTDKQNKRKNTAEPKSKKGNESATAQEGEDLKEVHEETWAEL